MTFYSNFYGFEFVKVYASENLSPFFRLMVVALQEKIAAFDACSFKSCFCITSEFYVKHEICICIGGWLKLFLHLSFFFFLQFSPFSPSRPISNGGVFFCRLLPSPKPKPQPTGTGNKMAGIC